MMRWLPAALFSLLAAALVSAQNSTNSGGSPAGSPSPSITVITSLSITEGVASDHSFFTSTSTVIITSTIAPAAPTPPNNSSSPSGGGSGSSSAASSTTTANLPTGTAITVTDVAPSPGATGGSFGPDDGYISAAQTLAQNTLLLGGVAAVVGFLAL